jgi:hypothetical protein
MSWMYPTPHPCPRCGTQTTGAHSEGGARWALCQGCLDAEHEAWEAERRREEAWRARRERLRHRRRPHELDPV